MSNPPEIDFARWYTPFGSAANDAAANGGTPSMRIEYTRTYAGGEP